MALAKIDNSEPVLIDAAGDVVLVVGDEKKKLRVSSLFLRNGSPVFDAMLSGRFAEGNGLSSTNPKEIPLEDDDDESMEILCNVLHLRNSNVPHKLDTKKLMSIAVLVDKYDLVHSCQLASTIWLSGAVSTKVNESIDLVTAAYLLRARRDFRKLTKNLVENHAWTVGELHQGFNDSLIPERISFDIERRREATRYRLSLSVSKATAKITCCQHGKELQRQFLVAAYASSNISLWKNPCMEPVGHYYRRMTTLLKDTKLLQGLGTCYEHSGKTLQSPTFEVHWDALPNGLCLVCISEDRDTPETCKVHNSGP